MAFYDEDEMWKCPKHPSKRRWSGVCPGCLHERLASLCPDCATVRPCACCPTGTTTTSSSSSASSSFSLFSTPVAGIGVVGHISSLIDDEPAFRRSRSVEIPFLRSRSRFFGNRDAGDVENIPPRPTNRRKPSSFWSLFKNSKGKKSGEEQRENEAFRRIVENNYTRMMMTRSKMVGVPIPSETDARGVRSSSSRGKGWYFPSPIKVFRQSKTLRVVQERSPLYRG